MAEKTERTRIEVKNISYKSAVFFGIIALIIYLILGIIQVGLLKNILQNIPEYESTASAITPLASLVITPLMGGIVSYLISLLIILVYNIIARKFPVSWVIIKK